MNTDHFRYHVFYIETHGAAPKYKAVDSEADLLKMVMESNDPGLPFIRIIAVVWGEALFVESSYLIKSTKDSPK